MQENSRWKIAAYTVGGLVGLLSGLAAAFLFVRSREVSGENPKLSSGQGVKIGLGIVALLRQIAQNSPK